MNDRMNTGWITGMMADPQHTIADPEITPETRAFWAEAAEGRLAIGRCGSCNEAHFYPRAYCPFCLSPATRLETASGEGRIYSYSIPRAATPFAIAFVTLAEGPTIMTKIVDCDLASLAIGQPVRLAFRASQGGQKVPVFTPAS
jgi:uncharacterized protein